MSGASAISVAIEPSKPTVVAPERSTSGQNCDTEKRGTTAALVAAGRPVVELALPRVDAHALGEVVMLFEAATALAGLLRGIDPFDQPGVEIGKDYAYGLLGRAGYESEAASVAAILAGK